MSTSQGEGKVESIFGGLGLKLASHENKAVCTLPVGGKHASR